MKNFENNATTVWYSLDNAENFYDRLMQFVTEGQNSTAQAVSTVKDVGEQEYRTRDREKEQQLKQKDSIDPTNNNNNGKVNKREMLGEFLGLYNSEVKRWIKSSITLNEFDDKSRADHPSFQEYFYSENLEDINAFERMDRMQAIFETLSDKLNILVDTYKKDESEIYKNPRDKSFNKTAKRIKTNKRKDITTTIDVFGDGEYGNDTSLATLDNPRYNKILNEELENRLRIDYRKHKEGPTKVFVAPSHIHKYGLFAIGNFNKHEIVIEYCGEVVRNKIADLREQQYKQAGFGDCFMFRIEKDYVVDASFKGNQARFLNHSCDPNCSSIILEVDKNPKIIIYANRPIYAGEELTYDYQFDIETEKIECRCGAKKCLGRLN
jgi:hypothetical protein